MTKISRTLSAVLVWSFTVACGCRGDRSITTQCLGIRDHLVEVEVAQDASNREVKAAVMRRALGDEFVASCARSMDEARRNCLLSATDSRSVVECSARSAGQH